MSSGFKKHPKINPKSDTGLVFLYFAETSILHDPPSIFSYFPVPCDPNCHLKLPKTSPRIVSHNSTYYVRNKLKKSRFGVPIRTLKSTKKRCRTRRRPKNVMGDSRGSHFLDLGTSLGSFWIPFCCFNVISVSFC